MSVVEIFRSFKDSYQIFTELTLERQMIPTGSIKAPNELFEWKGTDFANEIRENVLRNNRLTTSLLDKSLYNSSVLILRRTSELEIHLCTNAELVRLLHYQLKSVTIWVSRRNIKQLSKKKKKSENKEME